MADPIKTEAGEAREGKLNAALKKKYATIVRKHDDGTVEYKFPMPDKAHARNALARIDQSDLSEAEKARVKRRARRILGAKHVKEGEVIDPDEFPIEEADVPDSDFTEIVVEEVKGSSMGGHSPKADIDPERRLVRSFGKWARGKQSVCVKVLMRNHPELCAKRPGGCNGLCAWMKDQFLGTTKWRVGNKKSKEAYVDLGDGQEWVLPFDVVIDLITQEADNEQGRPERPDWLDDEQMENLIAIMDQEVDTEEADISYSEVTQKLDDLIRARKKGDYDSEESGYRYCWIKDVYPGYVIYTEEYKKNGVAERELYKQLYSVDSSGNVSLDGDPKKVVMTYVAAENDVEQPKVSNDPPKVDLSSEGKANMTSSTSTGTTLSNVTFVNVSMPTGNVIVECDKAGKIVKGPKSLLGRVLPPLPMPAEDVKAREALVGESNILLNEDEATELPVLELINQEFEAIESVAKPGEKITTPKGKEVDGIIRIIRPGPGNKRDKMYYTAEAIQKTIGVFEGRKMLKDHYTRKQQTDRDGMPPEIDKWVATVKETWADDKGIGYGGIVFVDEAFQAKAKKGKDDLGVSVRGRVMARPGTVNGERYNVVEGFTSGDTVDFVTEAGAGGGFVSIAESHIQEGDMDPKDMTLEQLMEANPGVFTEYADRLNSEGSSAEENEKEETPSGDELKAIIKEVVSESFVTFKEELLSEVSEGFKTRDQADNRVVLEQLLSDASDLPKATKERVRRELHDVTFDATEATDDQPAKTGMERFIDHAKTYMDECRQELKEATESITTKVDDGGASGELVVTESGLKAHKQTGAHDLLLKRLGQQKPAVTPVTNGKSESDASESETGKDEESDTSKDS